MPAVLRTRLGFVWLGLVAATAISFGVGDHHGSEGTSLHSLSICLVLVIAFAKIWWIGNDFMELRTAPLLLRGMFTLWCVVVSTLCVVLFLVGQ